MKNIKHLSIGKNIIFLYLITISQILLPLLTFPYLTRVLEPSFYGVVVYTTSVIMYVQIFVDFGFISSSTKKITESIYNISKINKIVSETIIAKIFLFIIAVLLVSISSYFINIIRENFVLIILYLLTTFVTIFIPDFLFHGLQKMSKLSPIVVLSKSISTMLVFILVKNSGDIYWIPFVNLIGALISNLLVWRFLKKINIRFFKVKLSDVLSEIKNSMPYFLASFATLAYGVTNTIVLGILNFQEIYIAYWGIGFNLISSAQSLYSPLVSGLYPRMIETKDLGLIRNVLLLFMPLIVITVLIVYYFSEEIIILLSGYEYIEATIVFRLLLPLLVLSFPVLIIGLPVMGVVGKVKEIMTTTIIAAVFHVMCIIVLIRFDTLSLTNLAILRCSTESVLLITRVYYIRNFIRPIIKGISIKVE